MVLESVGVVVKEAAKEMVERAIETVEEVMKKEVEGLPEQIGECLEAEDLADEIGGGMETDGLPDEIPSESPEISLLDVKKSKDYRIFNRYRNRDRFREDSFFYV